MVAEIGNENGLRVVITASSGPIVFFVVILVRLVVWLRHIRNCATVWGVVVITNNLDLN